MKKALTLLVVLAAAIYVASWFWAGDEVAAAAARPWPNGMGTLAAVPDRYPPQHENEAARTLTKLAVAVPENDAVTAYVRQEIARGELTIADPPAIAGISAIRDLLLREPVVWERDLLQQHGGLLPKVAIHLSLMRALVASALGRARQHDGTAWDDLHAAWNLTKSLDGHPHVIVRVVAMSMTRAINAVAWKMPLPVPAWFGEVQHRDLVQALIETVQFEDWRRWTEQKFPLKPFADRIERERALTGELARLTECEFNRVTEPASPKDPNDRFDIGWRRAFRYRVEREATANALRARAAQPIEEGSHCSDGRWTFDGTSLRFTKPIALPEQRDTSMPLTLHVRE
ncbi:MAG TPA: hypothetical protein VGQ65_18820 [Thermoanaerobaculia bacterium]|jgi:hypothetical protein|nr:hypothetical protein [Thermoanaerobaculia bacterium]